MDEAYDRPTTIQIMFSDKERIRKLKVHPAQPIREIIVEALDCLEEHRLSNKGWNDLVDRLKQ